MTHLASRSTESITSSKFPQPKRQSRLSRILRGPFRKISSSSIQSSKTREDAPAAPEGDVPSDHVTSRLEQRSINDSPTPIRRVSQVSGRSSLGRNATKTSTTVPSDVVPEVQSQPEAAQDTSPQPTVRPVLNLGDDYPWRTGITGTMEHFVRWCPRKIPFSETETVLHWETITGYFCTGILLHTTSIYLDEKDRATQQEQVRAEFKDKLNAGKPKARPGALIKSNHNKPDWCITYHSVYPVFLKRVCMDVEAKPRNELGTAMPQIITYLMKSSETDGCSMGLIVAGDRYRFLCWNGDKTDRRLYWVVPKSIWGNNPPSTMTLEDALQEPHPNCEWITTPEYLHHRPKSLRNLHRIFSHLERNIHLLLEAQQRGELAYHFDGRPHDLEDAHFIEIPGVWPHKPSSEYPPTMGVGVPIVVTPAEGTIKPLPNAGPGQADSLSPGHEAIDGTGQQEDVDGETDPWVESDASERYDSLMAGYTAEQQPYIWEISQMQKRHHRTQLLHHCKAWAEGITPVGSSDGSPEAPEIQAFVRPDISS